jgi:ubiquinone/menaquinone biosynthesis C-methylase UbiE
VTSSRTPEWAGRVAERYDELRASDDYSQLTDRLVAAGDLAGRRVLDVGCGTGTLAVDLATRYGCRVWGVDPSPEMLAVANEKAGAAARFKLAPAERLPFKEGWFERATMVSVAHHVERPRAFAELYRVLQPDGRLVISNADPDGFAERWVMEFFPELLERELARFPTADDLQRELAGAGFDDIEVTRLAVPRSYSRETALAKLRGRHISSFDLLTDEEYRAGLERVEREAPPWIDYTFRALLVVAVRPHL